MQVGETEAITAIVSPDNATDKTVEWGSSDVAVATVADGIITAKKSGEAIITAKSGSCIAECKKAGYCVAQYPELFRGGNRCRK